MQKLAEICIRRPVFATMLIALMVVVGAVSYVRLGVDRFPVVDLPQVRVIVSLPGASPEEMETEVAQVIEEAVNTIAGIEELRSVCGSGQAFVVVTFRLDREIDAAAQDVRDKVATVVRQLPEDIDPPVISKFDNESSPIMTIAVSGPRSLRELTDIGDRVVKPYLERANGVGGVQIQGELARSINVWLEADRLAAYQIPVTAVAEAIERQNTNIPGGNVTDPERERVLRTMGKLRDVTAFNDLVIALRNGTPIYLRDLATVEDGNIEQRSSARLNGQPTVTLEVRRQSGANTVAVIDAVKANLQEVQHLLPPDIKTQVIEDQSVYIRSALHEINVHLVVGSILACLVVLLFMRSWMSTIIAGIAIPTSVVATFGVMWAMGFTLNSVTMLGLVLMVGIVIDDAIVVLENIFRFIEEKGMKPFDAAREATREIGLAVLATTLSLVVIFIPVSFMSSVSGRFLHQFGITAAAAILVSLLVSFTLTPMMSARLLRPMKISGHDEAARSRGGFYSWLDRIYTWLLSGSLRFRWFTILIGLGVMASSVPLYKLAKLEFVPTNVDEASFEVRATAPEGTSFTAIDQLTQRIEKDLIETKGVVTVLSQSGGGYLSGVNQARIYVAIEPHEKRVLSLSRVWRSLLAGDPMAAFRDNYSQSDVMRDIRAKLRKYPNIRSSVRSAMSFNFGTGPGYDIDFAVRGPDLESLYRYADALRVQSADMGGIVDADITLKMDKPELRVVVDRDRAADLGVDSRDIATSLRLLVGGETEVSRFYDRSVNEDYDVQLRLRKEDRTNVESLGSLLLPGSNEELIRLDSVASIVSALAPSRIDRADRQRQVNLRAGIEPGYALADRLAVVRQAADDLNMPSAYSTAVAGRAREMERTYREYLIAISLSVVFMYMILAAQYESLVDPLTILLSLPLCLPFALFSVWAANDTLNLYSALGILVLFGVVKKNSILQIDHINQLRERGMMRTEAIILGSRHRLRPILMTTLAFVAGMLPLALGTGPGAEERRTISVVVIGGQTLSLLLTLVFTPVAYSVIDDLLARRRTRRDVTSNESNSAVSSELASNPV